MKKIKNFINKHKVACVSSVGLAVAQVPTVCFAADDLSTTVTSSFQTVVTDTLACIAAVAPIGITIFGAMFVWRKATQFFKSVSK